MVKQTFAPAWVDLGGVAAAPPPLNRLPSPADVLSGAVRPDFGGLRLRDPTAFGCGNLHQFAHQWDTFMSGVKGYPTVRPWIHGGLSIPSFFQHYKGEYKGRFFDSVVPPAMYFQNDAVRCEEFKDFIATTIMQRLKEGSIKWLGRVGVDPPPRVINAVSVEPTKPRLINSMKAVNLFGRDTPFSLTPMTDIVRHIPEGSYFSGMDDTQGYKHVNLTEDSWPFTGFEFANHWFCDTTLPFGWKNSAYVYFTIGEVLSEWLRSRGIYTELWIDDRFLGLAPSIR